jgi:hypothetical protein
MTDELSLQIPDNLPTTQIVAARVGMGILGYRLVMMPDGNGNKVPELQAYYAWRQGSQRGGEWKSLETQVWPNLSDDVPLGKMTIP